MSIIFIMLHNKQGITFPNFINWNLIKVLGKGEVDLARSYARINIHVRLVRLDLLLPDKNEKCTISECFKIKIQSTKMASLPPNYSPLCHKHKPGPTQYSETCNTFTEDYCFCENDSVSGCGFCMHPKNFKSCLYPSKLMWILPRVQARHAV